MALKVRATIEDLYRIPEDGKAELVNGEIVIMPSTAAWPSRAGGVIFISLYQYEKRIEGGRAFPDGAGFVVNLPHRQSFSPDAAFYVGSDSGMRFAQGAPVFAAEVRSENDYGPQAEKGMADKRADYFMAGTQVVWDVDLQSEDVVRVFRATEPERPTIYRKGEAAEAEPAVPGWSMPGDALFG